MKKNIRIRTILSTIPVSLSFFLVVFFLLYLFKIDIRISTVVDIIVSSFIAYVWYYWLSEELKNDWMPKPVELTAVTWSIAMCTFVLVMMSWGCLSLAASYSFSMPQVGICMVISIGLSVVLGVLWYRPSKEFLMSRIFNT